ncbi:hypothetical protein SSS_03093 [Sarcoptes scabiei]|uniref:Uncharacterized protein n=1 Tax=Sarcoptes scabiei TaxID=52283 RepID=A0A834R4H7_SARSC|nr:hypothetical protein SSS_03093 [Sarcoptes scabiei]
METNFETGFNMLSRLKTLASVSDVEIFDKFTKFSIFEIENCDIKALKAYLYNLIRCSLRQDDSHLHSSNDTNNEFHKVLIFDGQFLFNSFEFCTTFGRSFESETLRKLIRIFRPIDDDVMMINLHGQLQIEMLRNSRLKLIVIILNPSILFPDQLEKVSQFLLPLSISVPITLLTDSLGKNRIQEFQKRSTVLVLKCFQINDKNKSDKEDKNDDGENQIRIKIKKINSNESIIKLIKF